MWICQRCKTPGDGIRKICRACGGILEEVSAVTSLPESTPDTGVCEPLPPVEPVDAELSDAQDSQSAADDTATHPVAPKTLPDWTCPACGEEVPGGFNVCWNCGGDEPGTPPRSIRPPINVDATGDAMVNDDNEQDDLSATKCPYCGSTKLMRDIHVCDQRQGSDGALQVVVCGNPDALLFKDRLYGQINADICARCGHMQFRVANPRELYDHYRKKKRGTGAFFPVDWDE